MPLTTIKDEKPSHQRQTTFSNSRYQMSDDDSPVNDEYNDCCKLAHVQVLQQALHTLIIKQHQFTCLCLIMYIHY
jgi:hypothetical protein